MFFLWVWLNPEMQNEELALFHPLHLLSSDRVVVCYSSQVQKGTYRATVLISFMFSVESIVVVAVSHYSVSARQILCLGQNSELIPYN